MLKYATINSKIKKVSTENADALRSDPFAPLEISNWQLKMSVCCQNIHSVFKLNLNYFVIDDEYYSIYLLIFQAVCSKSPCLVGVGLSEQKRHVSAYVLYGPKVLAVA